MSHGRRCPHCLRELEPQTRHRRGGEADVAPEDDDRDGVRGEAVSRFEREAFVKAALKPTKTAKPARRRKRR